MVEEIMELYQSKEVKTCLRNNFRHDWEDIRQDVFERLFTMSPEKLENIQNLRHYLLRIIVNIKRQKYDPTTKLYRKNEELNEIPEIADDRYSEEDYLKQIEKVSNLDWYHRGILELYAELGSMRAVSEKTKIPFYSVKYTINESRKICKQES